MRPPRRIVFLQRSIPPDASAVGGLLLDLAGALDPARFDVTVLATRVPADAPREEMLGSVRIFRAGRFGFSRRTVFHRLAGLAGAWLALAWSALRIGRPDVIVTLTDPPLFVAMGALVAKFRGCGHVHWAQDLYPEVAVAGGVLRAGSPAGRMLEGIASTATRACDAVVAIGRCMEARLRARGVDAEKITIVPNWSRADAAAVDAGVVREFRRRFGAGEELLLLYSGNLGIVHDFETLLDAAEILLRRGAKAVIGIAGGGPRRAWIEAEVARRGLSNVRLLSPQRWEEFPSMLAAADAHVVTLKREFGGLVVPSKVYDAAASGRPILFIGPRESESARAIEECDCGAVVENGGAVATADRIERWIAAPDERAEAGRNAAALAARAGRSEAVESFSRLLESVAAHEHD